MSLSMEHIRQKWLKRLGEAAQDFGSAEEDLSEVLMPDMEPPPKPTPILFRRSHGGVLPRETGHLEEGFHALRESLAQTKLQRQQAETELEKIRKDYVAADGRINELAMNLAALEEKKAQLEKSLASLQDALRTRDEENTVLRGETAHLQATIAGKDKSLEEMRALQKELEAQLEELRAHMAGSAKESERAYAEAERRVAESAAVIREKTARIEELERELSTDSEESRQDFQDALEKKETEIRLLSENIKRLSQQNKDMLAALQKFQTSGGLADPSGMAPAAEPDAAAREKIESLELALASRDRMMTDQEKLIADKQKTIEELFRKVRELDACAAGRPADSSETANLTKQVELLLEENKKWRKEAEEKAGFSRETSMRAESLAAENAALSDRLKAAESSSADRASLESKLADQEKLFERKFEDWQVRISEKERRLGEVEKAKVELEAELKARRDEFEKNVRLCDELRMKNEELETQLRLLVMNSEAIDRMEKNLRETFRLMTPGGTTFPIPRPRDEQPAEQRPGFFGRLLNWWRAPLVKIPKKSSTAAPAPAVQRIQQNLKARRNVKPQ